MLIDAHHHIGHAGLHGTHSADEVVETMTEYGIEKTVVMPIDMGDTEYQEAMLALPRFIETGARDGALVKAQEKHVDNSAVAAAVEKYPNRLIGFFWVNPWLGERAAREAEEGVRRGVCRGFKLHPILSGFPANHEVVYPILELAKRLDVPVLFHSGLGPGAECWRIGELADRFPDVSIVMGHAGYLGQTRDAVRIAKKTDRVMLELSAAASLAVKWAIDEAPIEQLLFGSDGPLGHPYVQMKKIQVAEPADETRQLILGQNAAKLLKIR